jgi:hypothetical protein
MPVQEACETIFLLLQLTSAGSALQQARRFREQSSMLDAGARLLDVFLAWGEQSGCMDDVVRLPLSFEVSSHLLSEASSCSVLVLPLSFPLLLTRWMPGFSTVLLVHVLSNDFSRLDPSLQEEQLVWPKLSAAHQTLFKHIRLGSESLQDLRQQLAVISIAEGQADKQTPVPDEPRPDEQSGSTLSPVGEPPSEFLRSVLQLAACAAGTLRAKVQSFLSSFDFNLDLQDHVGQSVTADRQCSIP